mmetsp:Transcript_1878/g.4045  ORF Transcript_1878/g.4045 Transcript_1878/m.4045 type:complete len:360 (-) Transcript_1878:301-1380(-)
MEGEDIYYSSTKNSSDTTDNAPHDEIRPILRPVLHNAVKIHDITNVALRQAQPKPQPDMEGWLHVKREGFLWQTWNKLYCSLSDRIFKGMFDPSDLQVKFSLNFDLVSVHVYVVDDEIQIYPVNSSKSFHFKADNKEEFDAWAVTLHVHVKDSVGATIPLSKTTNVGRFWRKNFITMDQLHIRAQTGDLLLFKSKSAGGFAVRLISESDYDHVGLLVTLSNGKMYLMEALGRRGVQMINLEYFLANEWQRLYDKISYRPLICPRPQSFFDNFKYYAKKWMGKPYRLSMQQIMNTNPHTEEYTGFFCSQLVAAMYMKLGLLSESVPAADYWPRSFSDKKLTHMGAQVRLGQEMPVVFDYV